MQRLARLTRRCLTALDAIASRVYGWPWNPLHQSGTVAVAMLLALVGTGIYLLLVYRLGAPADSVARIAADPWLGSWIRTLHRYASDLFVLAAALHAARMFAQGRDWGPRTLAWVSGVLLLLLGLLCAWTGYVMAWDTFGERLAREGARLLDVLPVFSEPLSRIFAGDGAVPSAFFFVNLFAHIVLPLGAGVGLWLHVSRLARPTLLPPTRVMWSILGALTVASVLWPAALGSAADAFTLPLSTPLDLVAAWWLPLSERMSAGAAWSVASVIFIALLLVPRFNRRPRTGAWAPSHVDTRLCTGCNQCPQDCPWDAITMVKRDDDRPTLVAHVDASKCVSCGVCAGSCAPMGVGPLGRSGRDQLSVLRTRILPEITAQPSAIVAVCCAQAPASHIAALRARGAAIHDVPCVGNLHSSVVELLVRQGARGVIVCGCPPRDCVGREGPKWLGERFYAQREAELQPRVDTARVWVATLATGDLAGTLSTFDDFAQRVAALPSPDREHDVQLQAECEPVAAAAPATAPATEAAQ